MRFSDLNKENKTPQNLQYKKNSLISSQENKLRQRKRSAKEIIQGARNKLRKSDELLLNPNKKFENLLKKYPQSKSSKRRRQRQ